MQNKSAKGVVNITVLSIWIPKGYKVSRIKGLIEDEMVKVTEIKYWKNYESYYTRRGIKDILSNLKEFVDREHSGVYTSGKFYIINSNKITQGIYYGKEMSFHLGNKPLILEVGRVEELVNELWS